MKPGGKPGQDAAEHAPREALLLGVDGGGTKTVARLARHESVENYVVVGRGEAGSSNLRAVGAPTALANLEASVATAWKESGIEPREVEAAVLALSGAGQPDVQQQVTSWASCRQIARRLRIVHDGEAALAAAAPDGWGVALVAGTGSVAFGVDRHENHYVAGGWGYWIGDEGSAFWLGQAALQAVSHAADGRGPPTSITDVVLKRLQVNDPRAILAALGESGEVRHAIAQLADVVTAAAEQGDPVATAVVEQAAEELAAMAVSVAEQLALGKQFPLAVAGGVLCGSDLLRARLIGTLHAGSYHPDPVQLVPAPVAGCLKLASRDCLSSNANVG